MSELIHLFFFVNGDKRYFYHARLFFVVLVDVVLRLRLLSGC